MRSAVRLLFVLCVAATGAWFASGAASASTELQVPDSCSVDLDTNGVATVVIDPANWGNQYQVYRQGIAIETDAWSTQGFAIAQDQRVPNLRDVHYSIFAGEGQPRIYCGSITPVLKTCSVSVTAGNPVVGWSSNTADVIWRNGKVVASPYAGDDNNVGLIYRDYRYVDTAAGAIGQLGHYSVQWQDGSRTYCGNVTVPGRALSCGLSIEYEGLAYVEIYPGGFTAATAPGRPIIFRDGHRLTELDAFFDEAVGYLDATFTPEKLTHYSMAWQNDQGERTQRVYCGSIMTPEQF